MSTRQDLEGHITGFLNQLQLLNLYTALLILTICFVVYNAFLFAYRLTFHPLAKFPGPKLAGMTFWYECYYDVYKRGRYVFQLIELHKIYGPVLRINPNEIHIADSDFYGEIFHQKSYKTDRDAWGNLDHLGGSVVFTLDHDVHARRRASLNNYFSPKSIRVLEKRIEGVVSKMMDRMHDAMRTGTVLNLRYMFSGLTLDIIVEYLFGKDFSMNLMSEPDFAKLHVEMSDVGIPLNHLARHFKSVVRLASQTPIWLALIMAPSAASTVVWQHRVEQMIELELKGRDGGGALTEGNSNMTVLRELVVSPDLPPEDKSIQRLRQEAIVLLGAGSETTATSLVRVTFHILNSPEVLKRLQSELKNAIPDPQAVPHLGAVTNLPYLNAVIEEGLRIGASVMLRGPRSFQDHALVYKQWTIPPGMAVSSSTYMILRDPDIFPEPNEFKPERWLGNPGLQKYQVIFSKGRRSCLGINLAYAELRLALASVFRRFDLELYKTTRKDVDIMHDFFVGWPDRGSKGVHARVVRERD